MSLLRPRPVKVLANNAIKHISTRRSEPLTRKTATGLIKRLHTFVLLWFALMEGPSAILFRPVHGFGVGASRFHRNAARGTNSLRVSSSTNAAMTDALKVQPVHSPKKRKSIASADDGVAPEASTATKSKGLKKGGKQKDRSLEAIFWRSEGDPFWIEKGANRTTLTFKIRGNPLPLRRHRTSRGFMYNPSAAAQAVFSNLVRELVWPGELQSDTNGLSLFGDRDQLSVSMVFCMKRPLNHFTSSKRAEGRLKETASNRVGSIRTDVDNLAKFILDSLNGMIYDDDKQVASVHATKCYDSEGLCEGSTLVCIRNLKESDLEGLLDIKL